MTTQAARNKVEAAIARIVRRERFTEIQARNAADETIYAARHDATKCIQPRKLARISAPMLNSARPVA